MLGQVVIALALIGVVLGVYLVAIRVAKEPPR